MRFHVLTLFPEQIIAATSASILERAMKENLISIDAINIRDYAGNRHGKVDDYTYGGGAGLLMQAQPVYDACEAVQKSRSKRARVVYMTPQGSLFTQKMAASFAKEEDLILLCGHYEGIDERVLQEEVTDFVSVGDYVLTGGEIPAVIVIDAVSRLIPGVLGNEESARTDSFQDGLLEYPQYSRPENWHGLEVPETLMSGDHAKVEEWRLTQSLIRTRKRRPDLYETYMEHVDQSTWKPARKKQWRRILDAVDRACEDTQDNATQDKPDET
ncbi:MAG TPA: tRNA (guanosine(37)-N1)-methyltransferase TrmD [Lachnospiraceae bacterium]|nr:tRNA (guanosine(37)-N1)-methyltransferase TrmD [Lachnospiraceae bacterium]